ncbi:MAG: hypothetical protein EBS42_07740 [Caulobacteraceae bacterium]|jgi:hypothetical protein|nr:hypothetical protein [Caulobacteraceae bacterium]
MKILRFALVLIAYAGWLAWPFLSPFFEGAPLDVAAQRTGAMIEAGGGIPQAALWCPSSEHSRHSVRLFGGEWASPGLVI